jgi:3-deoxy-D-manno-octulosonic acid kinase
MTPAEHQEGQCHLLFDADRFNRITTDIFEPDFHRKQGSIQGEAMGRGTTQYVALGAHHCVLRHYRRGGAVAKLFVDQYLWTGLENTRAWREWHLLKMLTEMNLPAPTPAAARVVKNFLFYTADIITIRIANAKSLAEILRKSHIPAELWQEIGHTVKRFHNHGVYHADLNAHNIMVDDQSRVYLIDFDKGEIREPSGNWQQANLERLKRSLYKLKTLISPFNFHPADWYQFQDGYKR